MAKKLITRGFLLLALGVAALSGLLHALPYVGATAQPATTISAARGVAASKGLPGYRAAEFGDKIAAFFWERGHEQALVIWQIIGPFFLWAILAFVTFGLVAIINRFLPRRALRLTLTVLVVIGFLACGAMALWQGVSDRPALTQDLVISVPTELTESASRQPAGTVFGTLSALPYLVLYAPRSTGALDPTTASVLSAQPAKWREALRQAGWKAVVLSGPTAETQPLLDHLLASPDWRLDQVSNQGFFFLREKGSSPPMFDPEKFRLATDRDTAVYLAQIAERYAALRRSGESRTAIAKALDYAPKEPEVLVRAASLHAAHKRWQDTITYCDRALLVDPSHAYAHLLKALALLETGRPELAESEAHSVMDHSSDDPYTLFLYARICRSLHDYRAEAETLEKLIAVSKSRGAPAPTSYYVFLGQAYAKNGDADNALTAYRASLAAGDMLPDMASEVKAAIQTIERKNAP